MGKLSIFLPPFASDYTGVCSALYDLNFLTVITDASCCTGHYVYYDEPRWASSPRPVFSAQLRTMDAIMGNDGHLVDCVLSAAEQVPSQGIAVVGTPVPAITGMDMPGIACEIENVNGKTCLGFDTTGFEYYDKGIVKAAKALISRWCTPECSVQEKTINILGITPIDYGNCGNCADLKEFLESLGWKVNASLFMDCSRADFENLGNASLNLAVSSSGLEIAKMLKRKFGTDYVAAAPMGKEFLQAELIKFSQGPEFASSSQLLAEETDFSNKNLPMNSNNCIDPDCKFEAHNSPNQKLLIVGDQVMADSLRRALVLAGCSCPIDIAGFFSWSKSLGKTKYCPENMASDFHLENEAAFIKLMREQHYTHIIADPLMNRTSVLCGAQFIPLTHPAISADLHDTPVPRFLSVEFDEFINTTVSRLNS